MKYDHLLAQYISSNQQLTLKQIGTLYISSVEDADNEKTIILFTPDKNAVTSAELIDFIQTKFTKPKSLIVADIEDYCLQIIGFLNLGKQYTIEGVGTFSKLQNGQLTFEPGDKKIENISQLTQEAAEKASNFSSIVLHKPSKASFKPKPLLIYTVLTAILLISFFFIIKFIINLPQKNNVPLTQTLEREDTSINTNTNINPIVKDTLAKDTLNTKKTSSTDINDTIRYRMYFLASKYREKADKLYSMWSKKTTVNRDSIIMKDTLRHRLFIYKKAVAKDTTALKMALEKYFNHAIIIEQ